MSTRATVHFRDPHDWDAGPFNSNDPPVAIVFRHTDGYPSGLGEDLSKFFAAVLEQTPDTRFNDPSMLAARFVVWMAGEFAKEDYVNGKWVKRDPPRPLDFLSVRVLLEDSGDIEYRYHVFASASNDRPPNILVEERVYVPEGEREGPVWKLLGDVPTAVKACKDAE